MEDVVLPETYQGDRIRCGEYDFTIRELQHLNIEHRIVDGGISVFKIRIK